eukprot:IDg16848t1
MSSVLSGGVPGRYEAVLDLVVIKGASGDFSQAAMALKLIAFN